MLILLGIVILLISFVIALISMIREQREIKNREPANEPERLEQSPVESDQKEKPEARGIDILKSRIEELAAQEEQEAQKQEQLPQVEITAPEEKQMLANVQTLHEVNVGDIIGSDPRSPDGTSGTISVQDLVKKRREGRRAG